MATPVVIQNAYRFARSSGGFERIDIRPMRPWEEAATGDRSCDLYSRVNLHALRQWQETAQERCPAPIDSVVNILWDGRTPIKRTQ